MATTVGPTTPLELVETAYARYPRALADTRRRLGRPLTFAEKVLSAMRKGFGGHVEPGKSG